MPKNKQFEEKIKPKKNIDVAKKVISHKKPDEKFNKKPQNKLKVNNEEAFLLPIKKPVTYKKVEQKEVAKSDVLSKRDFIIAKEVFSLINQKKWKSAIKSTNRVKDKDFKNLITWMHLKEKKKCGII